MFHTLKAVVFSISHEQMWELDYNESWAWKNWCFWIVVLEKTLKSPLACKEIKPVNPKGNQPWIFIGRTDAETEAPILWPSDVKRWLTGKGLDIGKDWRQKEKRAAEDEMVSITNSMDKNLRKLREIAENSGAWQAAVRGVEKSWLWLSNWTTTRSVVCW